LGQWYFQVVKQQVKSGGVEYDKAALGTLIGAAAGYGISKGNANSSRQNNRAAAIGAVLVVQVVCILTKREKITSTNGGYWCRS
jgi:hypothetical protein